MMQASNRDVELLLDERLDEGSANKLKESLEELIALHENIKINAGKVSYITSPCIQILFNAGRSCSINGINFKITEKSNVVKRAFKEVGLYSFINQFN